MGRSVFAEAARDLGVHTAFGAELSLGLSGPQNGVPDPEGQHLLLGPLPPMVLERGGELAGSVADEEPEAG